MFGLKVGVEGAVGVEAGDAVAGRGGRGAVGLDRREIAADQDPAVGLEEEGADGAVGVRVESEVERAVGIEAGEVVARGGRPDRRAERGELACDEQFSVGLRGHDVDVTVDIGIETVRGGRALREGRDGAQNETSQKPRT